MSRFSSNLYYLRITEKLSQKDLADKLYVSNKTISKWERGASEPDLQTLGAIAKQFNVSIDDLLNKDMSGVELTCQEDYEANVSKYVKRSLALCVSLIAGYILSVACYMIFGDWGFVSTYGYDGRWIGFSIYIIAAVVCSGIAIMNFYAYSKQVKKNQCITVKREYFKYLYTFSGISLFTLAMTLLGDFSLYNIGILLGLEFTVAALTGLAVVVIFVTAYIYSAYRGEKSWVRTTCGITTVQLFAVVAIIILGVLYAIGYESKITYIVMYSIAGIIVFAAPFAYILIRRVRITAAVVMNYLVNAVTLCLVSLIPWLLIGADNITGALITSCFALVVNVIYKIVLCVYLGRETD